MGEVAAEGKQDQLVEVLRGQARGTLRNTVVWHCVLSCVYLTRLSLTIDAQYRVQSASIDETNHCGQSRLPSAGTDFEVYSLHEQESAASDARRLGGRS